MRFDGGYLLVRIPGRLVTVAVDRAGTGRLLLTFGVARCSSETCYGVLGWPSWWFAYPSPCTRFRCEVDANVYKHHYTAGDVKGPQGRV